MNMSSQSNVSAGNSPGQRAPAEYLPAPSDLVSSACEASSENPIREKFRLRIKSVRHSVKDQPLGVVLPLEEERQNQQEESRFHQRRPKHCRNAPIMMVDVGTDMPLTLSDSPGKHKVSPLSRKPKGKTQKRKKISAFQKKSGMHRPKKLRKIAHQKEKQTGKTHKRKESSESQKETGKQGTKKLRKLNRKSQDKTTRKGEKPHQTEKQPTEVLETRQSTTKETDTKTPLSKGIRKTKGSQQLEAALKTIKHCLGAKPEEKQNDKHKQKSNAPQHKNRSKHKRKPTTHISSSKSPDHPRKRTKSRQARLPSENETTSQNKLSYTPRNNHNINKRSSKQHHQENSTHKNPADTACNEELRTTHNTKEQETSNNQNNNATENERQKRRKDATSQTREKTKKREKSPNQQIIQQKQQKSKNSKTKQNIPDSQLRKQKRKVQETNNTQIHNAIESDRQKRRKDSASQSKEKTKKRKKSPNKQNTQQKQQKSKNTHKKQNISDSQLRKQKRKRSDNNESAKSSEKQQVETQSQTCNSTHKNHIPHKDPTDEDDHKHSQQGYNTQSQNEEKKQPFNTIQIFGTKNIRDTHTFLNLCKSYGIPIQSKNISAFKYKGYKSKNFDSRNILITFKSNTLAAKADKGLKYAEKSKTYFKNWRHQTQLKKTKQNNPFDPIEITSRKRVRRVI